MVAYRPYMVTCLIWYHIGAGAYIIDYFTVPSSMGPFGGQKAKRANLLPLTSIMWSWKYPFASMSEIWTRLTSTKPHELRVVTRITKWQTVKID